jgi:hypothetical protein
MPARVVSAASTCQRGDQLKAGAQRADLLMYDEKRALRGPAGSGRGGS